MKRRRKLCLAIFLVAFVFGSSCSVLAQREITLLAVGPMRAPTQKIVANFEDKTGYKESDLWQRLGDQTNGSHGPASRRFTPYNALPGGDRLGNHNSWQCDDRCKHPHGCGCAQGTTQA
jgi:hypothetical protein